ncbi:MAG: hypothetical protein ACFFBP_16200 [Promethearchaeota archaeon]
MDDKKKALRVDLNKSLSKDLVDIKNYYGIQSDSDMIRFIIREHKKELLTKEDYYVLQNNTNKGYILQENGSYEKIDVDELDLKLNEFDMDLIRFNLNPWSLSYILKGIFSKRPILLIFEHEYVNKHLMSFFEFITEDSFKVDISFSTPHNYEKNTGMYKEHLILKGNEILKDDDKLLVKKKLKIEREIVQNFFSEENPKFSLLGIRNDMKKAYILSTKMVPIINNADKISTKEIAEDLKENFPVDLTLSYLEFLIGILTNYYNINVPKIYNAITELL